MQLRKMMVLSVVGACAAGLVIAQEKTQPAKTVQVAQKAKDAETKKPSARMPNYYRNLELTDQQREKILNVLIEHNEQIDELEEQMAELKEKRDAEVYAVLTANQKAKLAELQMGAKKKRAEKAEKSKKAAEPATEEK